MLFQPHKYRLEMWVSGWFTSFPLQEFQLLSIPQRSNNILKAGCEIGLCGTQLLSREEVALLKGQQQSFFSCLGPSLNLEWWSTWLFHFTLQLACCNWLYLSAYFFLINTMKGLMLHVHVNQSHCPATIAPCYSLFCAHNGRDASKQDGKILLYKTEGGVQHLIQPPIISLL